MRFLERCTQCGAIFKKADKESHTAFHLSSKRCEDCQAVVRLDDFAVHCSECPKRRRHCCFCQLQLPFDLLLHHEGECGARTEVCDVCERYVLRRDMSVHQSECSLKKKSSLRCDNDCRKRIKKGAKVAS